MPITNANSRHNPENAINTLLILILRILAIFIILFIGKDPGMRMHDRGLSS
jgi:hypothetical protein